MSRQEERRLAVIALAILAGGAVLLALLYWVLGERGTEDRSHFVELATVTEASDEEIATVTTWLARRYLLGAFEEAPDLADSAPRVLFLTVGDERRAARVFFARGDGLVDAAERALALASAWMGEREWRRIKVDVVSQVGPPERVESRGELTFERGLDGLAFAAHPDLAFLPDEVVVRTLVNSDREIRRSNILDYLEGRGDDRPDLWERRTETVRTFRTRSLSASANELLSLFRGHRELTRQGPPELWAASELAGRYLARAVRANGEFVYSYLPKSDREKDDYNMLRHAGTTYSMLELHEESRDASVLRAAEQALDYLRGRTVECDAAGRTGACVEEKGYVKLGGNALAILALAKRAAVSEDLADLPLMRRLAEWMLSVQSPAGEFLIHKLELETGEVDDHISLYYPGEALFALMRLYELDPDPRWLDAASRGADWLIEVRDGALADEELSHDHWLLYALNELHRTRRSESQERHALRLARVIRGAQNVAPEFPDWRGSYYRPPRSTPTATRSEGLCAAYSIAARAGLEEEADAILEAARRGVDFQLQLQFRPETTLYLPNPARALGGFPRSLTNFEIRIDYVQHNLSSFLALRRILLDLPAGETGGL